jgi:membrane protease YdiL (CAAX protease family)
LPPPARSLPISSKPSLVLAGLVAAATGGAAGPEFPLPGRWFVVLAVLVAPLVETLLMIPVLWLLDRTAGPGAAAVGSALLWAAFHSLASPLWGLVAWWGFLILSIAFLTWWKRGTGAAILIVTAIHTLQNAVAALPVLHGYWE